MKVTSTQKKMPVKKEPKASKEEIESANEKLTTTIQELQARNDLLSEAAEFSEAVLATLHESMLVLDKNLRIKSANKKFYQRFKVKAEETVGMILYDLGNKQWNIPRLKELLEDILPQNTHFHDFEIVHNFPSIGKKIMMLNASRIIQKANQEELILLAISDVTEVRRLSLANANAENIILHEKIAAQQLLKEVQDEAQRQLQNIFLNAPAAAAVLEGPEHIYVLSNTAYQKLFNRQSEDFLGRSIREVFPELSGTGLSELVDQVYETGESFTTPEYAMLVDDQNDGVPRQNFYDFSLEPLKNNSGEIYAVIAMIYDITEQVVLRKKIEEAEKQLRELSIELEQKVLQRTAQLEEKNSELIKINKELEAFTYVSSHDLQEPVRKIQTFAGLILEKESQNLSDKGKNYFRLMRQEALRMKILIQDLLAFSQLDTADRKFENTDLNIIIEDVKKEFAEAIAEKHAVIEVKEICYIHVIPFQFRQLMHNLISNALKFSNPKIPPHITIESRNIKYSKINVANLPPQKEYCHITFSDNGIGFEKEFAEKIFEVFQKLHGKEEYTGTGIGLAIVKKIVDNHKGIITAKGALNKGATFDIYIPVSIQDNA